MLPCRDDLPAVELRRAVDPPEADQDYVVLAREATCVGERHVRDAGTALEAEDRNAWPRRERADPLDGDRDQARARFVAVLADDQRAAVGAIAAVFGSVVARVERQPPRVSTRRDRDRARPASEMEIGEAEHRQPDESKGDDSRGVNVRSWGLP